MRQFWVFNINKEMAILTRKNPYNIYKSLEEIYRMPKEDVDVGLNIFEQLIKPINIAKINREIYELFKNNDYYSKTNNKHIYYNKYRPEQSELLLRKTYILLNSNVISPAFCKYFVSKKNYFVCDFLNRDYFWFDDFLCINK